MKIKELIDRLSAFDGELEIMLGYNEPVIIQGKDVSFPVIAGDFSIQTLPSKLEYLAISAVILVAKD